MAEVADIAEFQGSRTVSRRTVPVFDPEKAGVSESSRTLRRQRPNFVEFTILGRSDLSQMWSKSAEWKGVGTSRVRLSETIKSLLHDLYNIREADDTLGFVEEHEFLFQWLVLLYPKVKSHFPGSKIYLEAVNDPETEDDRLVVFVNVAYSPDRAIELLDTFDTEWSSIVPRNVDQKVTVTVEFE